MDNTWIRFLIAFLFLSEVLSSIPREIFKDCIITAHGSDGFGHQVEGKLSCIIAGEIIGRMSYVHIPFDEFEHTPNLVKEANEFLDLGVGFYHVNNLTSSSTKHFEYKLVKLKHSGWTQDAAFRNALCSRHSIHSVDNCWDAIYQPPFVEKIDTVKKKLQALYFSKPKPETGFEENTFNIAVHVRRGDAGDRELTEGYFKSAINHYLKKNKQPVIWIMSDDHNWEGHQKIKSTFPQLTIHLPQDQYLHNSSPAFNLLLEFHRMVMAQGLVLSESSLSIAASLISNATDIVTFNSSYTKYAYVREKLFELPKFTRIPRDG